MKKYFSILALTVLSVSLFSCDKTSSSSQTPNSSPYDTTETTPTSSIPSTTDKKPAIPAEKSYSNVHLNCSVHGDGQKIDTIVYTLKDGVDGSKVQKEDFTIEGQSYGWSSSKEDGFQTKETHEFSINVKEISYDSKAKTLTLTLEKMADKYYYVSTMDVYCSSLEGLGFHKNEIKDSDVSTAVADAFTQQTFTFNNKTLKYNLFTPKETSKKLPLVVSYHGSGDQVNIKANRVATAFAEEDEQEKHPSYVIAPVFEDQSIEAQKETRELTAELIKDFIKNGKVDANRVYAEGKSMGGGNSIDAANEHPELFAGVLALCPQLTVRQENYRNLIDLPIYLVQGKNDATLDYLQTDNLYEFLKENGSNKVFKHYYNSESMAVNGVKKEKNHDVEITALEDDRYFDWLYSQTKEAISSKINYATLESKTIATGEVLESITLTVKDAESIKGLTKKDFTLTGKMSGWTDVKADNYRSKDLKDCTYTISDIKVEGNTLTVIFDTSKQPTKFFYLDQFTLTCTKDGELTITKDDIKKFTNSNADLFDHYRTPEFDYNIYSPTTLDETDKNEFVKKPLVVALHGLGDQENLKANKVAVAFVEETAQSNNECYVLAPIYHEQTDGSGDLNQPYTGWYEEVNKNIIAKVNELVSYGLIDENRIYITGKSYGGMNTNRLYFNNPNLFAAAMPMCGSYPKDVEDKIENMKDKPFCIVQGEDDGATNAYLGGRTGLDLYKALVKVNNNKTIYHEYTSNFLDSHGIGHHDVEIPTMEIPFYLNWLFTKTLNK